jgi:hypothetical protein
VSGSGGADGTGRAREGTRTYGIVEALDARDRDLGLSRSGPVLAAVEDAARDGSAPTEGRAVFVVTVDREKGVSVTLRDADKNVDAWRALAELVKAKAIGKPTRIPPGARGIVAHIEVSAAVTWPDGRRVRDTEKGAEGEIKGFTVHEDGTLETPRAGVQVHGKVCDATLRTPGLRVGGGWIQIIDPISGKCSVENIGTTAQRIVHGRILSEGRL